MSSSKCPCDQTRQYQSCCEPLHLGGVASTAEQLMRSRYSAFALGLRDYLQRTWHSSTCPALELDDNPTWVKLQILSRNQHQDTATVHFRAFHDVAGELQMLEERSRFVRENGRWLYLDGRVR